jgi:hypothetical protein
MRPAIWRGEEMRGSIGSGRITLAATCARKHLTAYIGTLYLGIAVATEVCFDFDITGNFEADVLLGSRAAHQFCIVEFEPAEEDAIFDFETSVRDVDHAPRSALALFQGRVSSKGRFVIQSKR